MGVECSKGSKERAASHPGGHLDFSLSTSLPAAHMDGQGTGQYWPCGHLHIACFEIKGFGSISALVPFPSPTESPHWSLCFHPTSHLLHSPSWQQQRPAAVKSHHPLSPGIQRAEEPVQDRTVSVEGPKSCLGISVLTDGTLALEPAKTSMQSHF